MSLPNNYKILFSGDSITDCDRQTSCPPLGNGYVRLVADMLKLDHPEKDITCINRGNGGHTIDDLQSRWADLVLSEKPDCIVIKVGINDCNRYVVDANSNPLQSPEAYAEAYNRIIEWSQTALQTVDFLLVSPFYISVDTNLPASFRARVRASLKQYIDVTEQCARKHNLAYLDMNAKFEALLEHMKPCDLAEDAVHPNSTGTLLIAKEIKQALIRSFATATKLTSSQPSHAER